MRHLELGRLGELLARRYLKSLRYRIAALNFSAPIGRTRSGREIYGEIDIVGFDGATLCFIEVKTRSTVGMYAPETAVDAAKQLRLALTAQRYRKFTAWGRRPYRFDVVSIVLADGSKPVIELLRGYFQDPLKRDHMPENGLAHYQALVYH